MYFGVDIILVNGLSKHTLGMYFPGGKTDPKYTFFSCFFLIFPSCSYQYFVKMAKNTPFFPNFKECTHVHCLVLKNDPNYLNFCTRMISTFIYKCPHLQGVGEYLIPCLKNNVTRVEQILYSIYALFRDINNQVDINFAVEVRTEHNYNI